MLDCWFSLHGVLNNNTTGKDPLFQDLSTRSPCAKIELWITARSLKFVDGKMRFKTKY